MHINMKCEYSPRFEIFIFNATIWKMFFRLYILLCLFTAHLLAAADGDIAMRAKYAVHGPAPHPFTTRDEMLQHFKEDVPDAQKITTQLACKLLKSNHSYKVLLHQAGYTRYAWMFDYKQYAKIRLPDAIMSDETLGLAILAQMMLIATSAAAKINQKDIPYVNQSCLGSAEEFQHYLMSRPLLRFFEAMWTMKLTMEMTDIQLVLLRRPNMQFSVEEWFKLMSQNKFPVVLPTSFEENLCQAVHEERFQGGYSIFMTHDVRSHLADTLSAHLIGRSYMPYTSISPQPFFHQLLMRLILNPEINGVVAQFGSAAQPIDPHHFLCLINFDAAHEGILNFPSYSTIPHFDPEVDTLFCAESSPANMKKVWREKVLYPICDRVCQKDIISDESCVLEEWWPADLPPPEYMSARVVGIVFSQIANAFEKQHNEPLFLRKEDVQYTFSTFERYGTIHANEDLTLAINPTQGIFSFEPLTTLKSRLILPGMDAMGRMDPNMVRISLMQAIIHIRSLATRQARIHLVSSITVLAQKWRIGMMANKNMVRCG